MKKRSKLFYATATTALVSAAIAGAASANVSFPDVKPGSSHYEAIMSLAQQDVIQGFPDGDFWPQAAVTRGQASKMIVKALNLSVLNPQDPNFSDVNWQDEYRPYIATLKSLGVIQGYKDGTFRSEEDITRAQMAKMIALAINLQATKKHPFTDIKKDSPTNDYVSALYEKDITKGTTAKTFSPGKKVTRGQLASFLYRAQVHALDTPYLLSVLHTNDVHSRAEAYPKLYTAIMESRSLRTNTLLLDAGDMTTGTLYFNEFQGEIEREFMSLSMYDAVTFGNHEFDLGSSSEGHAKLKEFVEKAEFPFVSSNIDFSKDPLFNGLFNNTISTNPQEGKIYSGIVKTIGGERVGIFGLTTAETKDISSPGSIAFENYIDEAEAAVAAFEDMAVNKIVALTHIGYDDAPAVDNDQILAKSVEGIDIIVGGHSHTQLDVPVEVTTKTDGSEKEPTLIVQAYQYGDFLGTLDVQFDNEGVIVDHRGSLAKVADFAPTEFMTEVLKEYKDQVDAVSQTEIGLSLDAALPNPRVSDAGNTAGISVRNSETILGNLITDGMYAKAQDYSTTPVIMAVQNGGGIRAAINAGPVTVGEVITVLPFGNTLALVNLTGAEIKAMFERSVKSAPGEDGAFLHVSGAKVVYDSSKPEGERVVSVQYKDATGNYVNIDTAASYTIATNAFTAKGGDNFEVLKNAYAEGRVTDLGLSDWENFADHLKSLTVVPTSTEGRVVDQAKK